RPQSTWGRTDSMTTRGGAVSFFVSLLRFEEHHGEWRAGDRQRMAEALVRHGRGVRAAEVAHAAAAVEGRVAVEELAPAAAARHADAVVVARHRREVAHHRDRRRVAGLPQERDDALLPVAALDPAEALDGEILLVERSLAPVERVQVRDPALHAFVALVHGEHVPFEARLVRPLAALAELAAHEQQLLAG